MILNTITALALFCFFTAAVPAVAQETADSVAGTVAPAAIGPARKGGAGPLRGAVAVQVRMVVPRACTITAARNEEMAVRCTSAVPYRATISFEADPASTLAAPVRLGRPIRDTLLRARAQRLTVEY